MTLAQRLESVLERIAEAAARSGRSAGDVTLIGVSKTVDRATVDAAYALGLRHFGENRVQDCIEKFATPLPEDATLHEIGQLQTNKAKQAVRLFDVIHSVDRPSLVDALEKAAGQAGKRVGVLVQVNVAGEDQKAGCEPAEAAGLIEAIEASSSLDLLGLMTMAPLVATAEEARPVFAGLRELRDRLATETGAPLPWLSMGMTNDFEAAIEEGATHVRVGRAIFA
ncbi:MAG: YggS family pyridoxal phosphate-dependent enzyme [Thermomicrobiales bacterium]|nr:YggS family pyridoxal phosphate-dependent enzyme [Thermomicrobiales bacterium]